MKDAFLHYKHFLFFVDHDKIRTSVKGTDTHGISP
jgi:hypothetical protein